MCNTHSRQTTAAKPTTQRVQDSNSSESRNSIVQRSLPTTFLEPRAGPLLEKEDGKGKNVTEKFCNYAKA